MTHTKAVLTDFEAHETRSTETWTFESDGGPVTVMRLITEGTEDDHDEIVVIARHKSEVYAWSSDPDYPFHQTADRVFSSLPDNVCDEIEQHTDLNMDEARA